MKSSTVRRSTLSRESMEVLEQLSNEPSNYYESIGEYIKEDGDAQIDNKTQEIDLLWQNFKTTQLNSNSTTSHILLGFIIGVISTIMAISVYNSFSSNKILTQNTNVQQQEETLDSAVEKAESEMQVSIPTEEQTVAPNEVQSSEVSENSNNSVPTGMKKYIVKDGDTGESIIKHFYGSYTPEREQRIIKVNNLKNLDRINIDQELLLPIE